jgi:phosphomannomutase/phosphoglucomutase
LISCTWHFSKPRDEAGTWQALTPTCQDTATSRHGDAADNIANSISDAAPFFLTVSGINLESSIFKAYDIRGIVGDTLTADVVRAIGQAVASDAKALGQKTFVIGRDGRLSGPEFSKALAEGIQAAGLDVVDLGMVATPMVYFAAVELGTLCGVMVTGSHNPPDYNGLKMVIAGDAIYGDRIQAIRQRIVDGDLATGHGTYSTHDISEAYFTRIVSDVKISAPIKIAIDCGNGVAGAFATTLYTKMGCEVVELFCEVDGTFPNHHPDPAHLENLEDLMHELATGDAEIGLAFDGDGDRLGVVTKDGNVIFPDRQLMLFAEDVLSRNPGGEIIYDVKCTRNIAPWVKAHGGHALMWKTGHSLIKAKLKESGAPLAGEMSGHIFFKDRWYGFDDGMYAGARMIEILTRAKAAGKSPTDVLNALPNAVSTPELQWKLAEGENFLLIDRLQNEAKFERADSVSMIDGLRVEYPDGFGLARSSNTTPVIVLRFESDTDEGLARIQADFRRVLEQVKPGAVLPF